jgi:hypothetical protein
VSDQPYPINRRRADASAYLRNRHGLNYAPGTLAKLASISGGPRFFYGGRFPLYPEAELDAFALSRISDLKSSTSDDGMSCPGGAAASDNQGVDPTVASARTAGHPAPAAPSGDGSHRGQPDRRGAKS